MRRQINTILRVIPSTIAKEQDTQHSSESKVAHVSQGAERAWCLPPPVRTERSEIFFRGLKDPAHTKTIHVKP